MFSSEYLAGIIDGEGTISIARQKNLTNGKPEYYVGQVYITNSNTRLLEALKEQFGGHITKARRNKGKNWKDVFRLQFYSRNADRIVDAVFPHLFVKQEQASLYKSLRAMMTTYKHPLLPEDRAKRLDLYRRCAVLNKRGITA